MPGKQAKILSISDVNDLLIFASCTRHPIRNRVIVLLAAKAGLRATGNSSRSQALVGLSALYDYALAASFKIFKHRL